MKKLNIFVIALLISSTMLAQAPSGFKYQAVLRDARGNIRANTATNIIIDILQGSATGTAVYSETHSVTTDGYGLINLEIGKGTVTLGTFSGINWGTSKYFVKVTVDGVEMGTSQLMSVPYALYADKAGNGFSGNYNDLINKPSLFDGTFNALSNKPTTVAGYGITDVISASSIVAGITETSVNNWNTAYSWGDHAGLYRPIAYVPAWSEITANPFSLASVANNQLIKYNSGSGKWENWTPNFLTAFTETDPVFSTWNKSSGISITASQISDFQTNVSNNASVLANTAKISYPAVDASKLAGIAAGAEVNVNADWNAASGDAQILNKPTIVTADGSETKVTAGTNVTVTGIGTTSTPYVINSTGGGGGFTHYIGELFGGGIIVAVWKVSGVEHGLIASLIDLSAGIMWTKVAYQSLVVPGGALSTFDGLANSNAIVAQAGAGITYAAGLCRAYSATGDGGLYDWYLPAAWEINHCYNVAFIVNTILGATNGFQFAYYWSSTEYQNIYAWDQYFNVGYAAYPDKATTYRVRAVRRF